jgi:hypothetical protein
METFLRGIAFLPHVIWLITRFRRRHQLPVLFSGVSFSCLGVEWHATREAWWWLLLASLRLALPCDFALPLLIVSAIYYGRVSRRSVYVSLDQLLFGEDVKKLWYVPHAGACALAEYSNGTGAVAVVATCRGKLLRLACLPLPDVMHLALIAGTEEVVKFIVSREPFFEAGPTFATVAL